MLLNLRSSEPYKLEIPVAMDVSYWIIWESQPLSEHLGFFCLATTQLASYKNGAEKWASPKPHCGG